MSDAESQPDSLEPVYYSQQVPARSQASGRFAGGALESIALISLLAKRPEHAKPVKKP